MSPNNWMKIEQKVCSGKEEALQKLHTIKKEGKKIVFTNGCFDLLHPGHLKYLSEARDCGDLLMIGVNTDDSVMRLKGKDRPIRNLQERCLMLAGLEMVDLVVPFAEDTPLELITFIKPDVLVKGGDYRIEDIVGATEVLSWKGEVKRLSFMKGYSTSSLIEKIKGI